MVIGWNIEKKRKKNRKKSLLETLALTDGLTKRKRALHNQRHESIKRLKELSSSMRCFQRSLDPSRAKRLLNECKLRLEPLTYQILRQQFGDNI